MYIPINGKFSYKVFELDVSTAAMSVTHAVGFQVVRDNLCLKECTSFDYDVEVACLLLICHCFFFSRYLLYQA